MLLVCDNVSGLLESMKIMNVSYILLNVVVCYHCVWLGVVYGLLVLVVIISWVRVVLAC